MTNASVAQQPSAEPATQRVTFTATNAGPKLVGVLHLPQKGSAPFPAAVVCHPHTQMGGNRRNSVVVNLCLRLAAAGWYALRFDFRGAGDSHGNFDGGNREKDDVRGALDFLLARSDVHSDNVAMIGYSFGAGVALHHAARDDRVQRMVGIALTLQHYDDPFLNGDRRRKLFVAAEQDSWAPIAALRQYVARLEPPKTLHVIPGVGHLFSGCVPEMTQGVVDWLTA